MILWGGVWLDKLAQMLPVVQSPSVNQQLVISLSDQHLINTVEHLFHLPVRWDGAHFQLLCL